ncbi:hypothetical protein NUSPORA_00613 [Nucleospora cyclopteri]
MTTNPPSTQGCSVFVGNIDFEIDEATVVKELRSVGKVKNFRMMYDKNTGKSKGYGFCEYESPEIAETAMKTLNIIFNGRNVKINYAENDLPTHVIEEEETKKEIVIDKIIKMLDGGKKTDEILQDFKLLAVEHPTYLKDILDNNPSLVCALMYLLLSIPHVKNDVIDLLRDSFNVTDMRDQIEERILNITQKEIETYSEDVKNRFMKIKFILMKKDLK